jgi:hypothetical protein
MTAPVKVEQCDREAANIGICSPHKILSGELDAHSLVQSFARHRIAAVEQEREECARLVEKGLELGYDGSDLTGFERPNCSIRHIASAIRSRLGEEKDGA